MLSSTTLSINALCGYCTVLKVIKYFDNSLEKEDLYGVAFVSKIKIDRLGNIDWQIDWKIHSQLNRSAKGKSKS